MQLKTKGPFGDYPSWTEKPYGVRVEFEVGGEYFIDEEKEIPTFVGIWDEACIFLSETHVFHFERDKAGSKYEGANIWNAYVEGFETAEKAANAGRCFATALMFNSVMYTPDVNIRYSLPEPFEVYSRRLPKKQEMRSFLTIEDANIYEKLDNVVESLREAWFYTEGSNISERVFIALELYSTAQFENSNRAKLIDIVSAIEALAIQKDYSDNESYDIDTVLNELCEKVDMNSIIPEPVRASMKGQIRNLKRESVRRACSRLIEKRIPEYDDAIDIFENTYGMRSKLLHEGETPANLDEIVFEIEDLARHLLMTYLPNE